MATFRLIWSSQLLQLAGHDIDLVWPKSRQLELIVKDDHVTDVHLETDVVVFQRVTHRYMAEAIPILRAKGVAVVVDVDDDLNCIHPANPAYNAMHPRFENRPDPANGTPRRHSWHHISTACREATTVTVSTPGLLDVYARHGRGKVIYNYLPDTYFDVPHTDSGTIGWPAALASHPDDPSALGGALARLTDDGAPFIVVGDPTATGRAFGLQKDPDGFRDIDIHGWPEAVARIGVGIAPLADTKFNRGKSWLKPLEMSALGVPWVGSNRAEYARLNRRGAGRIADTPRRWFKEMDRLCRSAAARDELAAAGREVAGGLRIRDNAYRWIETWTEAYDRERQGRRVLAQ